MKKSFIIFCLFSVTFIVRAYAAVETVTISLTPPENIALQACPSPLWQNQTIVWKGITDKRSSPEVGRQTKKGQEILKALADPALTEVLSESLKDLLQACGLKFSNQNNNNLPALSAEITEFIASEEKKVFTGQAKGQSSINLTMQKGSSFSMVTVRSQIEAKGMRQGKVKKLTKTLNDLLKDTLLNTLSSTSFLNLFK